MMVEAIEPERKGAGGHVRITGRNTEAPPLVVSTVDGLHLLRALALMYGLEFAPGSVNMDNPFLPYRVVVQ